MNVPVKHHPFHRAAMALILAVSLFAWADLAAAPAKADFGVKEGTLDLTFVDQGGLPVTQAGSHQFDVTTEFELNKAPNEKPDENMKDAILDLPAGFVGDATAYPRCPTADFIDVTVDHNWSNCPVNTAVGVSLVDLFSGEDDPSTWAESPVYNLSPPPGVPVRFGYVVTAFAFVIVDVRIKAGGDYNAVASVLNASQIIEFYGASLTLWGDPANPAHDGDRGQCGSAFDTGLGCPTTPVDKPFLTLPRSCPGPAEAVFRASSWQQPTRFLEYALFSHDGATPPNPQGFTGCGKLNFQPTIESQPTTDRAETSSGLDFDVHFNHEGLTSNDGLPQSEIRKAVVTLPEGVTVNPSIGEGLGVCAPADVDRETLSSDPGEGCPNSSKIGSVSVETPLLDQVIDGDVFLAKQDDPSTSAPGAENPFDSMLAFYIVLRNPQLGILVKLPAKVEPHPTTGQLVTTLEDTPQLPFSSFNFHFREGQRAPLVTPAACGTYTTEAVLTPWANPSEPLTTTSSFEITEGVNGGPCPPGGVPPFKPQFEAGAINNNAGSFTPFNMRLLRNDGEQDMTKFSSVLPPGQVGSLVGVEKCPDAAVDVAKSKTGLQEIASPSCPANSRIGRTLAGAGVGGALTYVPGQIYLAGPYKGAPLSVISITPAVAGPFDAGTVAVRLGLDLNPKTAEVEVDGAASDPIPHILKGIVLKLRDLRVYVDRPNFILNPTSCDESSAKATLFGSFLDVFNSADDVPVDLATRYQAANCLNLGFKPHLKLNLKGGTKRGGHPGLKALYRPRKGDANVEGLVVRLPRSAFLDQAHIRTICTRVQFAEDNCPKAAQYGYIKAWTPLLEEPLQGPVWLRSSNHKLPDLVFDLHGLVDVEVATRIDSVRGGIRAKVESAPDAPLSKVELRMQGGKKGLIVNSRNLCAKRKARANVQFNGHNGRRATSRPVMQPHCRARR